MCFVNDLVIHCWADRDSVRIVRKALDDFVGLSSLVINLEKSLVFFLLLLSGVDDEFRTSL